jgi:hypothetical protein
MFKTSKSILSFGACALALGVRMLAAPRANHAIAATLVQVTNTASNPAGADHPNFQDFFGERHLCDWIHRLGGFGRGLRAFRLCFRDRGPAGATPFEVVNGPSTCAGSLQLHGYLTSN